MKCVLLTDIKKLEVKDLPDPVPSKGEVIVAVKSCSICGSDVHFYNQGRIGSDRCVFPQGLGHECAGVVHQAPPRSQFKPGDRVAVDPGLPCYSCEHCQSGNFNRCPAVKFLASPGMQGALREYLVVDERQLSLLPETMSFDAGALLEPMGVAFHAVELSKIASGESVAIYGAGAVGLLTLALVKMIGAGETFIIDRLHYRLEAAASQYGANHIIDSTKVNPVEYIKSKTKGRGVDVVFEAAGEQQTFDWTFESARIGGRCYIIGIPEVDSIVTNPHIARRRELLVQNVRRSNQALDPCIAIVKSGKVKIDFLATHHFPLEQVTQAFEMVGNYQDKVIRAIVTI